MPDSLPLNAAVAPLDADALIVQAQYTSSHFEPVDAGLRTRFHRLVGGINRNPLQSLETKRRVELQLRKLLDIRLRLVLDRQRIPGIAQEKIERPIVVIGFSRTGTTLLHSLLAEDKGAIAPQWWHTHLPSPPPGEVPVTPTRLELAAQELDELLRMAPGLLTLHPYWDKRAHALIEDEEIFTIDFLNAYPSLLYHVPALGIDVESAAPADAYVFHKQFLQHLQWNHPGAHCVTKGIYHQFALEAFFKAYPDALCIWPHRSPAEIHTSTMAITAALYGAITDWTIDMKKMGPDFVQGIKTSLDRVLEDPLVDHPQIFHVDFREMTKDPVATIRAAYSHWSKAYTPEFETSMRGWLADPANRPDRYGRYNYSPQAFGLDKQALDSTFAAYRKRFNLI